MGRLNFNYGSNEIFCLSSAARNLASGFCRTVFDEHFTIPFVADLIRFNYAHH